MNIKNIIKESIYKLSPKIYTKIGLSSNIYFFLGKYINKEDVNVIEIGGHFGIDTIKLSSIYPKGKIVTFEADERNYKILVEGTNASNNIKVEYLAVSNRNGLETFYQSMCSKNNFEKYKQYKWINKNYYRDNNLSRSGASSLSPGDKALEGARKTEVRTVTLEKYTTLNEIESTDLLWIDVQGAEGKVFEGAGEYLSKVDYIWVEYGYTGYKDALTRNETIDCLRNTHRLLEYCSDSSDAGNLFFQNLRLL